MPRSKRRRTHDPYRRLRPHRHRVPDLSGRHGLGERAYPRRGGLQRRRAGHHLGHERPRRIPAQGNPRLPRNDGSPLRRQRHADEPARPRGGQSHPRGKGAGRHHRRGPARRLHEGMGACGHQGGARRPLRGHRQARGARGRDRRHRRGLRIRRPRGRTDHHGPRAAGGGRGGCSRAGCGRHRRWPRHRGVVHARRAGRAGRHALPLRHRVPGPPQLQEKDPRRARHRHRGHRQAPRPPRALPEKPLRPRLWADGVRFHDHQRGD